MVSPFVQVTVKPESHHSSIWFLLSEKLCPVLKLACTWHVSRVARKPVWQEQSEPLREKLVRNVQSETKTSEVVERESHWKAGCRGQCALTPTLTGSLQGKRGSRDREETIILTRDMVASTRKLAVEVTRSDWALDIRKDVQEWVMSRMTQGFSLSSWKEDSGTGLRETRSAALKNIWKKLYWCFVKKFFHCDYFQKIHIVLYKAFPHLLFHLMLKAALWDYSFCPHSVW